MEVQLCSIDNMEVQPCSIGCMEVQLCTIDYMDGQRCSIVCMEVQLCTIDYMEGPTLCYSLHGGSNIVL